MQQSAPTPAQIEAEVLENVRSQPLADGTVADLALPEEFLRRVADRIVRESFEERYRIVVEDPPPPRSEAAGVSGWIVPLAVLAAALAIAWAFLRRRSAA